MKWSRNPAKQKELIPATDQDGRLTRIETRTTAEFLEVCARLDAGEFNLSTVDVGRKCDMNDGYPAGVASAVFNVWYPEEAKKLREPDSNANFSVKVGVETQF